MNDETENLDLDDILDMELDDLEDLPEFKPFPPGVHRCQVTLSKKTIGDHPAVEAALKHVETLELDDSAAVAPSEGDETSVAYMMDNEFGRGNFKKLAASFVEFAGTSKISAIVDAVTEVECLVVSKTRKDKNDKDKLYMDIKELQVV